MSRYDRRASYSTYIPLKCAPSSGGDLGSHVTHGSIMDPTNQHIKQHCGGFVRFTGLTLVTSRNTQTYRHISMH